MTASEESAAERRTEAAAELRRWFHERTGRWITWNTAHAAVTRLFAALDRAAGTEGGER